ncbi:hypothetical protein KUCAC02_035785 [Chaenocephalus aceratus]|nr:hypothetical protein KUCAC02_035785 [Chaenocephalus aceratus]
MEDRGDVVGASGGGHGGWGVMWSEHRVEVMEDGGDVVGASGGVGDVTACLFGRRLYLLLEPRTKQPKCQGEAAAVHSATTLARFPADSQKSCFVRKETIDGDGNIKQAFCL